MGIIPLQRKITAEQTELQSIFSNKIPDNSVNKELKEYKEELGNFDLFGLINK
jgi:hypothetical protein